MTPVGYWLHDTSGVLRPAVECYLRGIDLTPEQVAALRAYLRQWIAAPEWAQETDEVDRLRDRIDELTDRPKIDAWLRDALALGIDPL